MTPKNSDILNYKIGDRISGDYLVKDIFGGENKSGMGVVYLVENRKFKFPFVIKTYQQANEQTDFAAQFKKEAEAWVSVGVHPNIVKALWVDVIDFRMFVAAEFIEKNEDGRNCIRDFISFSAIHPFWVLNWAAQFCYGMKYAQAKGLLFHRDIKPENLLVNSDRILKITDFGLASINQNASTFSGGTLPYMAPEQFSLSLKTDFRADIYAFGIIMYEMISGGSYPYDINLSGKNVMEEFINGHVKLKPKILDTPIFALIEKCLEKNPIRFRRYDEFLEEIVKVSKKMSLSLPPELSRTGDDEDEELYARAVSFNNLGKKTEALKLISSYVQKSPQKSSGWTEKGKILLELGRYEEAEKAFLKSISLFEFSSSALNNLGIVYGKLKRYKEASLAFHKALEFDPANSGAIINLALMYFNMNQYSKSADLYLEAIRNFPRKETLLFNAGNSAAQIMKEGFVDKAILIFIEILKVKPNEINNWHNLGLCYWDKKMRKEAIDCFQKVILLDPTDGFALSSLAKLNAVIGNYDEALKCALNAKKELSLKREKGSTEDLNQINQLIDDLKNQMKG